MSVPFTFGTNNTLAGTSTGSQRPRSSPVPSFPTNTATFPYMTNATGAHASVLFGPLFTVKQEKKYIEKSCQTEDNLYGTKFMQGLKRQLQTGQFSDITLNVSDKEIRAHKNILAANSPVFAAMFEHDTKEKDTNAVDISDIDPDIFPDFLQFMYSGSTDHLNSENVIDLYIVADKYQVTELIKACSLYMMEHISLETFCDIMSVSLQYQDKELLETATNYFLKNSIYVTKTAKWLIFMKDNVAAANDLFTKVLELNKDFYSNLS